MSKMKTCDTCGNEYMSGTMCLKCFGPKLRNITLTNTKPTGLVKVEKCTNCRDGDIWYQAHAGKNINLHDCPRCKGEGLIRTDLTAEQAVEVLKDIIVAQMHIMLIPPDGIELHNGSRIELKEKP